MIIPDVNLLLYANMSGFPQHKLAQKWMEDLLSGNEEVGIPTVATFGFIRIATSRRVFKTPLSVDQALKRVESWMMQPQVTLLLPGRRHLEIAFTLLRNLGTAQNLTTDAQLAAHAIENQAELHSNDSDFARFPGLRWVNPLS
ncbi:MAG: type II toxin-antitoxin system VapC family toxin [Polyangiaceae bacterium]|nr:type II toxin-antitoxin system VapC family toxin [Polyangiaceae bacterium]